MNYQAGDSLRGLEEPYIVSFLHMDAKRSWKKWDTFIGMSV